MKFRILLINILITQILFCVEAFTMNNSQGNKESRIVRKTLKKIFEYSDSLKLTIPDTVVTYNYSKCRLKILKRNPFIWTIPSMFQAARDGHREYISELYDKTALIGGKIANREKIIYSSTTYKNRKVLDRMQAFLQPNLYSPTLINDYLLSPFCRQNKRYYIYHNVKEGKNSVTISFKPKTNNTQLVRGTANIDHETGRIISCEINGEYDLTKFNLFVEMGQGGFRCLYAKKAHLQSKLSYLGNSIKSDISACYDIEKPALDTIKSTLSQSNLMNMVRPYPLSEEDSLLFIENDTNSLNSNEFSNNNIKKRRNVAKYILWDIIGDNIIHRYKTHFGETDNGVIKIGPLFNPLYFGYNKSKGLVYKFSINVSYDFSEISNISLNAKTGYSFKQRRFFVNAPLTYTFNSHHKGFVNATFQTGNRITNSSVLDRIKEEPRNSKIDLDKYQLDYFNNTSLQLVSHYDLNEKIGLQTGFIYHKRKAVRIKDFTAVGHSGKFTTFAPLLQIQYRPKGYKGIIFTWDYEHGLKDIFGSEMNYDRWEFDASYIRPLPCMRYFSMKAGFGFYTTKGNKQYFLDYANFKNNNIPGGWYDEWTGEFELLNSNWYNVSDYYVRWNSTYESPLLLLSWCPLIGQVVEKERIYASALIVRKLYPYVECGYGFTNRVFSMGIFLGASNHHFEGVGLKLGLELFDNW